MKKIIPLLKNSKVCFGWHIRLKLDISFLPHGKFLDKTKMNAIADDK